MKHCFVGSPAPTGFLEPFGQGSALTEGELLRAQFSKAEADFRANFTPDKTENARIAILVRFFQRLCLRKTSQQFQTDLVQKHGLLGPSMELRDTHARQYTLRGSKLAPDGQICRKDARLNPPHAGEGPQDKRTRLPADVVVDFKASSSDPFMDAIADDGSSTLALHLDGTAKEVLGQLIDYADLMFDGTFRTHAFMLFFAGALLIYVTRRAHSKSLV
jgi:hypothetical protein